MRRGIGREVRVRIEAKKIALRIAGVAKAKKAQDVIVLDIRKISSFCDYFVILSCASLRQVNAIAQAIEEDLDKDRVKTLSKVSANDKSGWIVLDFSSVVTHIFYKPLREFYSLERLWSDAKKIRIPKAQSPPYFTSPNERRNLRFTHPGNKTGVKRPELRPAS